MKNERNRSKLDLKDKRLLSLLSMNYRFPVSFLSRKVGLSKDSVSYRIRRFWKEGVITGTNLVFNPFLAGIEEFFVLVRFNGLLPAREKNIISFLKKKDSLVFFLKLRGSWDFLLLVGARDAIEFDEFMAEFRNNCSDLLDEFIFLIASTEHKFKQAPEAFFSGIKIESFSYKRNDSSFQKCFELGPPMEISHGKILEISDREIELLRLLNSDMRKSITALSMEAGVSKDKLKKDISSLIDKGFLQSFWPFVSSEALGFQDHLIFVKFKKIEDRENLDKFFRGNKFVSNCFSLIGKWDLYVWLKVNGLQQLYGFIEDMRKEFSESISSVDSMLVEKVIKFDLISVSNILKK